jgi:hypothetical protein
MINLFVNYFRSPNIERQKELNYCLEKNINNMLIDKIYVFIKKDLKIPYNSNKIHLVNLERPTYKDFIDYINSKDEFKESYNVISNTDIYFDKSLILLDRINMNNTCVTLNRWNLERDGNIKFFESKGSQDVWIFKGHIKKELAELSNFYLGVRCCDLVFLKNIYDTGYRSVSPSIDLKSIHVHNSNFRTDVKSEIYGIHMYIDLCMIEDLEDKKPLNNYYRLYM